MVRLPFPRTPKKQPTPCKGEAAFFGFYLSVQTGKKKVSFSISTIMPAATSENTMQPAPSPLRLSLMNLKPMTKIRTVMAARATDMPTMAIQYNISNNAAKVTKPPLWVSMVMDLLRTKLCSYYTIDHIICKGRLP
jgi:hypothetical protein